MSNHTHPSEMRLKAAVIDRLLGGSHVDKDAVIISEMTVANWTRRADVVLANGTLWAFEIKSNSDSLHRLPGQIEAFRRHFEKFTIVAAERFEAAICNMMPEGVGLWIVDPQGRITQRVPPRQTRLSKAAYISLMTAAEIKQLLSANGIAVMRGASRSRLAEMAESLPQSDLGEAARNAVKRRHRSRHNEFIIRMGQVGTTEAMPTFHRAKRSQDRDEQEHPSVQLPETAIPIDHPLLVNAPAGPVLKRLVR